jgi:hypothetical protein
MTDVSAAAREELERELFERLQPAAAPSRSGEGRRRVRSHCRCRNRGTEYVSESGVKWFSGSTERQCDRALGRRCRPNRASPHTVWCGTPRGCEPVAVQGSWALIGPARSRFERLSCGWTGARTPAPAAAPAAGPATDEAAGAADSGAPQPELAAAQSGPASADAERAIAGVAGVALSSCARISTYDTEVYIGLGRIVALCYRSSTLYQNH